MADALADVVVLDLTREYWSAMAAAMLGDFGARVIRVENLGAEAPGDLDRDGPHSREAWDCRAELVHRNKRSLAIDLTTEAGRKILEKAVATADVFLIDWPFSEIEACGLGYEALSRLRSDIIYARGSGFGPKGPNRELPALDELAAARTGMMPILPQPGEPPVYTGSGQMYTAVMIALGILLALHHRAETGEGQEVDASLFGGNLYGASLDLQAYLAMGGERFLEPVSRLDAGNPMSGTVYRSADGRWVTLTMPDTDRWWPAFSELVGLDVDDPRFDTHEKRCGENRLLMMQVLEALFLKQPSSYWRDGFNEKQLSADVIEAYSYPAEDEQARRNRYVVELQHPSYGAIKTLGFPIYLSESPARFDRMAPCRGQHSADILREMLGYAEAEIETFEENGIIG